MPKKTRYSKNSIIYFRGEESKEIYLVSEGEVQITFGMGGLETKKRCAKGDFFGMHSAIGAIGRNDDAMSLTDVVVLIFDVKEFEDMITKTPKLSLQLMKMLSHELREVHRKAKNLVDAKSDISPEQGLFMYAQAHYEKQDYKKLSYVVQQYEKMYPTGEHIQGITKLKQDAGL